MPSHHLDVGRWVARSVFFLSFLRHVPALTVEYCSSLNTASGDPTYWNFQSNGWCHDHCVGNYAFAIVQDFNCWCSDYAPGVTSSSDNCNTQCPGYSELCGGNGYYGYIALGKMPSGTVGASDSAAPSTPASTPDPNAATTSTPDSTPATWTPTPITSVETITGRVRTITITPTSPSTVGENSGAFEQTSSHGLNTGQAVGLTIGLVALIAVIGAVIFFCVRKRRQSAAEPYNDMIRGDSSSGPMPKRTMSEASRYMLGTDGRQVVEGWEPEDEVAGSRRSRLMPVDPRLDPFAPVYQRGDGSKSRESVATIRDDHDYSRRVVHQGRPILRATNPDE